MANIKKLKDNNNKTIYPMTSTSAVYASDGKTLTNLLQQIDIGGGLMLGLVSDSSTIKQIAKKLLENISQSGDIRVQRIDKEPDGSCIVSLHTLQEYNQAAAQNNFKIEDWYIIKRTENYEGNIFENNTWVYMQVDYVSYVKYNELIVNVYGLNDKKKYAYDFSQTSLGQSFISGWVSTTSDGHHYTSIDYLPKDCTSYLPDVESTDGFLTITSLT